MKVSQDKTATKSDIKKEIKALERKLIKLEAQELMEKEMAKAEEVKAESKKKSSSRINDSYYDPCACCRSVWGFGGCC